MTGGNSDGGLRELKFESNDQKRQRSKTICFLYDDRCESGPSPILWLNLSGTMVMDFKEARGSGRSLRIVGVVVGMGNSYRCSRVTYCDTG